jgi:dTDP-4-dehydrorhamnose reductase
VRTSAFFGPSDGANFVTRVLDALARGENFPAATDAVVSPTYVPHLVEACLDLLIDGAEGVWHLANAGALSWWELARRVALMAGFDPERVLPRVGTGLGWVAERPAYSALGSERARLMPTLEEGLARYLAERLT